MADFDTPNKAEWCTPSWKVEISKWPQRYIIVPYAWRLRAALEQLSSSHLIELSVLAPSGSDAVAEDMKNFADQLKPLVFLDKVEPRRQGM